MHCPHGHKLACAFVPWQQRKQVCADLKAIYAAATESEAEFNLELFAEKWDKQYPSISKSWRSHWANIIPFFAFPPEIRRAIYTTNAIESMNSSLRKVIKSQQIFPSDDAAFKLVYLAMRNISKKWTRLDSRLETCTQSLCHPLRGSPPHIASRLYTFFLTVSFVISLTPKANKYIFLTRIYKITILNYR